ncbi:acyltransferase family protein [soil metagenome]
MTEPATSAPPVRSGSTEPRRRDIQALRAIAVLGVVLFHIWPNRLTGGYAGVDVFFVVSGFLLTSHLLREVVLTGTVRLAAFWARRARRLLPAALLVLLVSVMATLLIVPQSNWISFLTDIGASAGYVVNWLLASNAVDYLASEAAPSVAQHYWSLSVEEQFYIVWPLLIVGAILLARRARSPRLAIALVLGVVTSASLIVSVVWTASDPQYAYFATPVRAWEFGLGALTAMIPASLLAQLRARRPLAGMLSVLGVVAILVTLLFYTSATPFPGYTALLPVLGTVAVIVAGDGAPATKWVAGLPPVQWIGDVSYSAYLWHWPIVVLVPYVTRHTFTFIEAVGVLVVTFVLAFVSERFVENPARRAAWLAKARPRRTLLLTAAGMAVVIGAAVVPAVYISDRITHSLEVAHEFEQKDGCFGAAATDPENQPCINHSLDGVIVPDLASGFRDAVLPDGANCRSNSRSTQLLICTFGSTTAAAPRVALVGDSHAEHWVPALTRLADTDGFRFDTYLKGGCPFSTAQRADNDPKQRRTCTEWNAAALREILAKHYDVVVTSSVSGHPLAPINGTASARAGVNGLIDVWTQLQDAGITVVAIRDVPKMPFNVPTCLTSKGEPAERISACVAPESEALATDAQVQAAQQLGVHLVDLTPFFCQDAVCHSVVGSVIVYRDEGHLGGTFSRTLAPFIQRQLGGVAVFDGD